MRESKSRLADQAHVLTDSGRRLKGQSQTDKSVVRISACFFLVDQFDTHIRGMCIFDPELPLQGRRAPVAEVGKGSFPITLGLIV